MMRTKTNKQSIEMYGLGVVLQGRSVFNVEVDDDKDVDDDGDGTDAGAYNKVHKYLKEREREKKGNITKR